MSIAEFYGWTHQQQTGSNRMAAECTACGAEMNEQSGTALYECERCMNDHAE